MLADMASAAWRTSSYSAAHGDCVEAATLPTGAAIRDSKHPDTGHLTLPTREWAALLGAVRTGEL